MGSQFSSTGRVPHEQRQELHAVVRQSQAESSSTASTTWSCSPLESGRTHEDPVAALAHRLASRRMTLVVTDAAKVVGGGASTRSTAQRGRCAGWLAEIGDQLARAILAKRRARQDGRPVDVVGTGWSWSGDCAPRGELSFCRVTAMRSTHRRATAGAMVPHGDGAAHADSRASGETAPGVAKNVTVMTPTFPRARPRARLARHRRWGVRHGGRGDLPPAQKPPTSCSGSGTGRP